MKAKEEAIEKYEEREKGMGNKRSGRKKEKKEGERRRQTVVFTKIMMAMAVNVALES